MRIKKFALSCLALLLAFAFAFFGCTKENNTSPADEGANTTQATERSKIVHRVIAGGADLCIAIEGEHPGCNGNYSLEATIDEDGNVKGQFDDQFGHGDGGFHAVINCLVVDGNEAWVGGIITSGFGEGSLVFTRLVDNGPTGDQISYSFIGCFGIPCITCDDQPAVTLYDMTGQVKVW